MTAFRVVSFSRVALAVKIDRCIDRLVCYDVVASAQLILQCVLDDSMFKKQFIEDACYLCS